jgi:hypothetical protein
MTNRLVTLLTFATFVITGCSSPVANPTAILPTVAAASQPPQATATTAAPTLAPTATVVTEPDYEATATAVVETVKTGESIEFSTYISPDDKWQADVVRYDCVAIDGSADTSAYEELRIIGTDVDIVIDTQLQNCGGLGAFGLDGLYWSANSQYFYYTDAREGQPDGGCGYWERPIYRFDTLTNETLPIGSGPLSPDSTKLATWYGDEFVIWDLNTGAISRTNAAASELQKGPIAWSPDSQATVYLQIESACPPSGQSYLVRVDLPGSSPVVLIDTMEQNFVGVAWTKPDSLTLTDGNGVSLNYDFATGRLALLE